MITSMFCYFSVAAGDCVIMGAIIGDAIGDTGGAMYCGVTVAASGATVVAAGAQAGAQGAGTYVTGAAANGAA